jgi:hypothetical protein
MNGIEPTLYNLPGMLESNFIVVVEGENKADALIKLGICATCNTGGAGKWKDEYAIFFRGKAVVILPDNDKPGKDHAAKVAASVAPVASSVKIVELPGLPHKGDILDWLTVPDNDVERLRALMNDAPLWKADLEENPADNPFSFDWRQYTGTKYLHSQAPAFDFLLDDAFVRGDIGVFAGPPGSGKGTFALDMAVYIAAGIPVYDFWRVPRPGRTMYLSCEDSDTVIHNRLQKALKLLPEQLREHTAENVIAVYLCGSTHLVTSEKRGQAKATDNLIQLEKLIKDAKPDLLFLDTLSRFLGVDEIDNAAMTDAIGFIEKIARENSCSIIFIHHTNKDSQSPKANVDPVKQALNQAAIRGSSALVGCARFCVNFFPLPKAEAKKLLGSDAGRQEDETFLAVRCVKKNIGAPEPMFFCEKKDFHIVRAYSDGQQGTMDKAKEESLLGDVEKLVAEVARREATGEKPLSVSRGCRDAFGWRDTRSRKTVERAIDLGELMTADGTRGTILKVAPKPDPMDMFDFNQHGSVTPTVHAVHADTVTVIPAIHATPSPTVHTDTVTVTPTVHATVHATVSPTVHATPRVQSLSYGENGNLLYTGVDVHATSRVHKKSNEFNDVTVHGDSPSKEGESPTVTLPSLTSLTGASVTLPAWAYE